MAPLQRETYTVQECAEILGINKNLAYQLIRENRLPHLWLGKRRVMVPKAALERFLASASEQVERV